MARLKLQRFRASEPPDDVQARYIRVYKGRDLHYRPQAVPPISAETLFGVSAPLVLDLGCGRGEFLVAQAGAQPDRYFVGFEWHIKSVWDAAHRAHAANLDNVRIVRADLRLALPIVPDGAADEVLLLFPPPKLAPNERKDDLLSEPLLRQVHRVLLPGGLFHFVTDHAAYFTAKRALIEESGLFAVQGESSAFEGGLTRFQRIWEAMDIASQRLACRRL
ncbi:MAG: methyltransferase domain-containing protein [Anaerolineae bacterium]|nr:methyltransferase domain-containing protein [Anaerolineae bacterium]